MKKPLTLALLLTFGILVIYSYFDRQLIDGEPHKGIVPTEKKAHLKASDAKPEQQVLPESPRLVKRRKEINEKWKRNGEAIERIFNDQQSISRIGFQDRWLFDPVAKVKYEVAIFKEWSVGLDNLEKVRQWEAIHGETPVFIQAEESPFLDEIHWLRDPYQGFKHLKEEIDSGKSKEVRTPHEEYTMLKDLDTRIEKAVREDEFSKEWRRANGFPEEDGDKIVARLELKLLLYNHVVHTFKGQVIGVTDPEYDKLKQEGYFFTERTAISAPTPLPNGGISWSNSPVRKLSGGGTVFRDIEPIFRPPPGPDCPP